MNIMPRKMHAARPGFTLLEILCVIALLTMLGGILTLLLMQTLEVERSQARSFEHMLQTNTLADQFRADVAQALSAPKAWEDYTADSATLILQMKNAVHVVYLWRSGKLQRRAYENQKVSERLLPIDRRGVSVEFARSPPDSRLVRLRLHVTKDGKVLDGQTLDIAAALGGDLR